MREVAQARPDAITTFCTNPSAAQLAHELEAETGVPLYDTVSTVVWKALEIAGADTSALRDWGRLFS